MNGLLMLEEYPRRVVCIFQSVAALDAIESPMTAANEQKL